LSLPGGTGRNRLKRWSVSSLKELPTPYDARLQSPHDRECHPRMRRIHHLRHDLPQAQRIRSIAVHAPPAGVLLRHRPAAYHDSDSRRAHAQHVHDARQDGRARRQGCGKADEVGVRASGLPGESFRAYVHPQIAYLESSRFEEEFDHVLADVVPVSLDRPDHDRAPCLPSGLTPDMRA
jgi:hypothetical protein